MTEAEWLACNFPWFALHRLGRTAIDRKRRLFAVACCRRIEDLILRFKGAWRAVILAERIADGETISDEAQRLALELPGRAFCWIDGFRQEKDNNIMWCAGNAAAGCLGGVVEPTQQWQMMMMGESLISVSERVASAVGHQSRRNDREPVQQRWVKDERVAQVPLLHCIFGNPFRPVTFSSEWKTDTALSLARQMYESRDFSAMPILADALQDAGCENADILNHCRGAGPHVRGCWVVDLVLGKE
jgi:hypothetical protein